MALPTAPLKRIAKDAGIERVAADADIAAVTEAALKAKFAKAAKVLSAMGKKTLTKELLEAVL